MKFSETLLAHLTPEWRKQYIDYDELKEFLIKSINEIHKMEDPSDEIIASHLDACDGNFLRMCNEALKKIEFFFSQKIAEANVKFLELSEQLDAFLDAINSKSSNWLTGSHVSISWKNSSIHRPAVDQPRRDKDNTTNSQGSMRLKHLDVHEGGINNVRPRFVLPPRDVKMKHKVKKEPRTLIKIHDLKLAFSEFYLSLALLQNYQQLNYTGFRKILKKHDKLFQRQTGFEWRTKNVDPANFNTSTEVDGLISKVEDTYINKLEQGDRGKAMKRLRVPPLSEKHNPYSIFRFGLFAGIFITQSVVIVLTYIYLPEQPEHFFPAVRFFRAVLLLICFLCLFGINVYGWRTSGVNHILIFEIDPRTNLDHWQLLEISFMLACCWGFSVIYFLYSEVMNFPPYASPFVLVICILLFLLNPFKFGYYQARLWLLKIVWRIFRAPFVRVNFPDFWLADQLNSLGFIFPEFAFFICFYSSQIEWSDGMLYIPHSNLSNATHTMPSCATDPSPFIGQSCQCSGVLFGLQPVLLILPAWFRFAQCLRRYRDMPLPAGSTLDVRRNTPRRRPLIPHVLNAGKYASSFLVAAGIIWFETFVGGSPALTFVVISYLIQSVYTYMWDILMDWGLMDKTSENKLLREELVYRYHAYYYVAMVEDLVLRLTWTIRVGFIDMGSWEREVMFTVLSFAEVFRRFVWNFFRLENEHLNNCGEFRAVRDISIMPSRKFRLQSAASWANTAHMMDRAMQQHLATTTTATTTTTNLDLFPRALASPLSPHLHQRRGNHQDNDSDTGKTSNPSSNRSMPRVVDRRLLGRPNGIEASNLSTQLFTTADRRQPAAQADQTVDSQTGLWSAIKSGARQVLRIFTLSRSDRKTLTTPHAIIDNMELVQNPGMIQLHGVLLPMPSCPADVETQLMGVGRPYPYDSDAVGGDPSDDHSVTTMARDGPSHSSHSDLTSSPYYSVEHSMAQTATIDRSQGVQTKPSNRRSPTRSQNECLQPDHRLLPPEQRRPQQQLAVHPPSRGNSSTSSESQLLPTSPRDQLHTSQTAVTLVSQCSVDQDTGPTNQPISDSHASNPSICQLDRSAGQPPEGSTAGMTVTYYLPEDSES